MASIKGGKSNFVTLYLKIQQEHRQKYGQKTIVLMQKGHFYELYSLTDDLIKICDLLNILITRANKKGEQQVTIDNPYMAGFQVSSCDRFIKILLDNNFTVVIVDEIHKYENNKRTITRKVTRVLSPATNIESSEIVPLMCVYIDKGEVCITWADLTTGRIGIFTEVSYKEEYVKNIISNINPKEVVIYSDIDVEWGDNSSASGGLNSSSTIIHKYNINPLVNKISYQNEFLERIYNNRALGISPIENLKLERFPLASACLVYLLDFVIAHDSLITTNLQIPHIMNTEKTITLSENCITQLNLDQVIRFVDYNSTPMGSRLLRTKILNPYSNTDLIRKSYDSIHSLSGTPEGHSPNVYYKQLTNSLKAICDVDKYCRKINMCRLSHVELIKFYNSLENIETVIRNVHGTIYSPVLNNMVKLRNEISRTVNLDIIPDGISSGCIFKNTHNAELDNLISQKRELLEGIKKMKSSLCSEPSYLETEKVNGIYIYNIKRKNLRYVISDKAEIKSTKSQCRITCKELEKISERITDIEDAIFSMEKEEYNKFLTVLGNKYTKTLNKASGLIAEIDNNVSCLLLMEKYKFCVPKINETLSGDLRIQAMRHPIIESQISNEYTPNNLTLDNELTGMLLYGLNFSGKTSYIRTVGICVILAQAGLPVPAESMTYTPFANIITKISLGDNLNRNQSTFTNEIKEIKRMIECSTANSLILADELCSGTEINSALSLVSTTIYNLAKNNCKFIFTTHYHQLVDIPHIKSLTNVKPYHMKVDIQNGKLIFNRTLQEGKCMDNYGIEIAQFMKMPMEFIHMANTIRNELNKDYVVGKPSRYNSDVYMTECKICGSREDLHTHHIIFQSQLDTNEKHYKNNLIVLCEQCHQKVHKNELQLDQIVETY